VVPCQEHRERDRPDDKGGGEDDEVGECEHVVSPLLVCPPYAM
jgi:hypothetical protein